MIKTLTFSIFLFICSVSMSFAQTGSVTGTVKTSDGSAAEFVSVTLKGTNRVARSSKNGEYQIKNIKPGSYTLTASYIGLQTQQQSVEIRSGETTTVHFILKENADELREVIISSRNSNKVNVVVAKMPLKNLENPQVYNSVPLEILKQQVITSYDDALRNVPGITRTWESTGRAGDGASYFALRGFDAQPSLINGLPGLTSGNLDPSDVEEIQVIKGPSATLFGGSFYSYGGFINTITKKPYYDFGGEVTYNQGSYGLNRLTVDVNAPLSKTKKIALRINTAIHREDSFQDAGFKKSFFIAPSLSYEVNDRLSFNILAEILEEKRAIAPVFFHSNRTAPLDFKNLAELNLDNKLSFTSNDLTTKNPRYNLQGQMSYKLSDQWHSQTVISGGRVKSDGMYTYIWDDEPEDDYFDQYFHNENQVTGTIDIQQNFNGDFKIGGLRNRLLVGLDYYHRNVKDNGSGWASGRRVTPQGGITTRVYYDEENLDANGDPTRTEAPAIDLTKASVNNLLAGMEGSNTEISNSSYSAYFSDVLNFTPNFSAMVSLRTDYFDSPGDKETKEDDFDQFVLSQKLGLVYQPIIDKVSVFANYMNAFINKEPGVNYNVDGVVLGIKSFKPEHANQWEFGVKTNLFSDKLNATVSYYNIKVTDRVYTDPANQLNSIQGGKVRSQGFEVDINVNPVSGLNLIAGYSHNSIKVLTGASIDFYNEPGRTPGGQGPQDLANLWTTYKFGHGTLKDFGLGIGGNYAGKYKAIDNSITGVFYLPDYTLLNGGIFYNSRKIRVAFNVNNLTNEQYYIGYWSVNPQKQRNFAASLSYKF
ncbi:MAG TPA: TonB-dependent receptor [Pedobacter sp.]|uniref:TonB-dependent receptor n=1 Tax=Pedobacter sp. TaxID=1411316 RepID=UPI002C94DD03|nr:TonB-dependent receptor [Pedobacter sp.]HMI01630.1 TonB-dependent receptor [Pedobacter sp.]